MVGSRLWLLPSKRFVDLLVFLHIVFSDETQKPLTCLLWGKILRYAGIGVVGGHQYH